MKYPKVTIFVPVKNGERTLRRCIDSILKLDYPRKEIWFIDNMSTDSTPDILKSYGKKIKWKKMSGKVPKMHNYVLRNVKTKFLAYTNADCVVKKDWLKKLIEGFDSDEIVATAGYFGTPKDVDKLQLLIGREMEERFKKFHKYISRAPDANLCVRADIAKKVKFNENFFWSWESDFCYRLNEHGTIKYIPKAVVYHYHRATWKGFWRQQVNNAKIKPILFLLKHKSKMFGDHISTPEMALTLLLACLIIPFLFLSIFLKFLLPIPLVMFFSLFLIFLKNSIKLSRNIGEIPWFLVIFAFRTTAWVFGLTLGFIYVFRHRREVI